MPSQGYATGLTMEKALIFRITHIRNVPWILENGLSADLGDAADSDFVTIGNPELIDKRSRRQVPIFPGGVLSDYIPFYFTPFSMMAFKSRPATPSGSDGMRKSSSSSPTCANWLKMALR